MMSNQNITLVSESTTPTGIPVYFLGLIEFVKIPEGEFTMGSSYENKLAHPNEIPQLNFYLPEYWMSRYPITNEQYIRFTEKTGYPFSYWFPIREKATHPVTNISWYDAVAFCEWFNLVNKVELDNAGGLRLFIPSEAEWEKAARGKEGKEWPWGNEFDKKKCNCENDDTTPVDRFSPVGDSSYGCADMIGNVWEFTRTRFQFPRIVLDESVDIMFTDMTIKGGASSTIDLRYMRCAYRDREKPNVRYRTYGFRVCLLPKEISQKCLTQMIRAE
jgi:formylglycine-generating enzyme required for sulfatase activity